MIKLKNLKPNNINKYVYYTHNIYLYINTNNINEKTLINFLLAAFPVNSMVCVTKHQANGLRQREH